MTPPSVWERERGGEKGRVGKGGEKREGEGERK